MARLLAATLAALGLVATACGGANAGISSATPDPRSYDESPSAMNAQAALLDKDGRVVGSAGFKETRQGVRVEIRVTGLPPGDKGVHIHGAAKCDPPDFASAGGHFNPGGRSHGLLAVAGPHAGDLPNLQVASDGTGHLLHYNPNLSLNVAASNGLLFAPGTSIVVHEIADDGTTDPSGNSGARIACGIIKRAGG